MNNNNFLLKFILLMFLIICLTFFIIEERISYKINNQEISRLKSEIEYINSQKRFYLMEIDKILQNLTIKTSLSNLTPISYLDVIYLNVNSPTNKNEETIKEPKYLIFIDNILSKIF